MVLLAQATSLGWTRNKLRWWLKVQGWTRIHAGAYAWPGIEVGLREHVRAHQLAAPELVAGHWTAARLHDAEVQSERLDLIAPKGSH
ncbi:hypothetical protein [Streptomyces thioluteus]|uniref:hypothetical protein n=1 Tax=Streptomyces thioluteus TaxID=66431 RepID=UPI0031EC88D2